MNDMNQVWLIGRLTRDAETPSGDRGPVKLSLAVNRRVKKGGEWGNGADFIDIEYWHRSLLPNLTKGKQVAIVAELKQDRWEQDGQNRSRLVVVARDLQLLGGGQSGSGTVGLPSNEATNIQADGGFPDDIPF